MPSEYAKTLGARLRAIRTQQGLSLHGVEEKSRGRWKAVVVGSYERGDRSVTVQKLAELAEFYGVPVSELLPGDAAPTPLTPAPKLVIDLERMAQLPREQARPLSRPGGEERGPLGKRRLDPRQQFPDAARRAAPSSPARLGPGRHDRRGRPQGGQVSRDVFPARVRCPLGIREAAARGLQERE